MRIISGKARGTKLYTLEGKNTRPTLDRVKEAFFNIIQEDIPNSVFLDLFAGSGAIGLEAASRGASQAILCEKSKEAIQIIQKNIEKTHLVQKVKLYQMDFADFLQKEGKQNMDIIYIDPPYQTDYAKQAISILLEKQLISESTKIIIETDQEEKVSKEIEELRDEFSR